MLSGGKTTDTIFGPMKHRCADSFAAPFRQHPPQSEIHPRPISFGPALNLAVANDTLVDLGNKPLILLATGNSFG